LFVTFQSLPDGLLLLNRLSTDFFALSQYKIKMVKFRPRVRYGSDVPPGPVLEARLPWEFKFDRQSGELQSNGHKSTLQEKPFQVLLSLLERPGELITRKELKQRLWPSDTFVDFDHGLNKAVNRLREALHDSAEQPLLVRSELTVCCGIPTKKACYSAAFRGICEANI